jgi:hypothetical protein
VAAQRSLLSAGLVALGACSDAPPAPGDPLVSLEPASLTLIEGQRGVLTVPRDDGTAALGALTWRVAPVTLADARGTGPGVAHGTAQVTARRAGQGHVEVVDALGRARAVASLNVRPLAECLVALRVGTRGVTVVSGESRRVRVTAETCDRALGVDTSATYAIDDTAVARVDAEGVVTGRRPGVTNLRVAAHALPAVGSVAQLTVVCGRVPLVALSMERSTLRVATGDTIRLRPRLAVQGATCLPADAPSGVRYLVGDALRLRVDEQGLASARRAGTVQVLVVSAAFPNVGTTVLVTIFDP